MSWVPASLKKPECCDGKAQIQALERTQPGLLLGMGHIATETHDYYRHGTITLFAALKP